MNNGPVLSVLNARIENLLDHKRKYLNRYQEWIMLVYSNRANKGSQCQICGQSSDSSDLELHHVAGRKHSNITILLCLKCHQRLSTWQKGWDARWLSTNQLEQIREAFILLGVRDILTLKAEKTNDSNWLDFAEGYFQDIQDRLRD